HLDGARIFNAAAALGVDARLLVEPADSVTFCLSKGLCAPVGSVLCGSEEFIRKARRIRKQVGGGMRQAGILAAAGIIALDQMTERLGEDHQQARRLAQTLEKLPGLVLDPPIPATNMVFVNLTAENPLNAGQAAARLLDHGVKASVAGPRRMRLVTHYWIDDQAVDTAVRAFESVFLQEPESAR
ncbi:MAG TPA: GntG family PLP-dependent aldolase, partial [Anaerolineaceae bacterium]